MHSSRHSGPPSPAIASGGTVRIGVPELEAAYASVQRALADDPPYVWVYAPDSNVVFSTKIAGYHTGFTEPAHAVFGYANIAQWS